MPGAEVNAVANMHAVHLFRKQQTELGEVSKSETPATAAHSWPIALIRLRLHVRPGQPGPRPNTIKSVSRPLVVRGYPRESDSAASYSFVVCARVPSATYVRCRWRLWRRSLPRQYAQRLMAADPPVNVACVVM